MRRAIDRCTKVTQEKFAMKFCEEMSLNIILVTTKIAFTSCAATHVRWSFDSARRTLDNARILPGPALPPSFFSPAHL
jgi:hypothetical protein